MPGPILTAEQLRQREACPGAVDKFRRIVRGNSIEVTEARCVELADKVEAGQWEWLGLRLLPDAQRATFLEIRTEIQNACTARQKKTRGTGCTCSRLDYARAFGRLAESLGKRSPR